MFVRRVGSRLWALAFMISVAIFYIYRKWVLSFAGKLSTKSYTHCSVFEGTHGIISMRVCFLSNICRNLVAVSELRRLWGECCLMIASECINLRLFVSNRVWTNTLLLVYLSSLPLYSVGYQIYVFCTASASLYISVEYKSSVTHHDVSISSLKSPW